MSLLDCSFSLRFRRAFAEEPCHANPDQVVPLGPGNCERAYISKNIFFFFVCDLCHITFIAFALSLSYLYSSLS